MPDWMDLGEDQDKVFVFEGELVDIWESGKSKEGRGVASVLIILLLL
jgi:hypothetical protein